LEQQNISRKINKNTRIAELNTSETQTQTQKKKKKKNKEPSEFSL